MIGISVVIERNIVVLTKKCVQKVLLFNIIFHSEV